MARRKAREAAAAHEEIEALKQKDVAVARSLHARELQTVEVRCTPEDRHVYQNVLDTLECSSRLSSWAQGCMRLGSRRGVGRNVSR